LVIGIWNLFVIWDLEFGIYLLFGIWNLFACPTPQESPWDRERSDRIGVIRVISVPKVTRDSSGDFR